MSTHARLAATQSLVPDRFPALPGTEVGLWGPKIQRAYEEMGVLHFAELDPQALQEEDERIAQEIDGEQTGRVDPGRARKDYIHAVAREGAAGAAE